MERKEKQMDIGTTVYYVEKDCDIPHIRCGIVNGRVQENAWVVDGKVPSRLFTDPNSAELHRHLLDTVNVKLVWLRIEMNKLERYRKSLEQQGPKRSAKVSPVRAWPPPPADKRTEAIEGGLDTLAGLLQSAVRVLKAISSNDEGLSLNECQKLAFEALGNIQKSAGGNGGDPQKHTK